MFQFQQMCWLSSEETDAEKVLYLRFCRDRPWKPYWDCPEFAIPDYDIPKSPKGLATYHILRRWDWTLVSSTEVRMNNITDELAGLEKEYRSSINAIEANCRQLQNSISNNWIRSLCNFKFRLRKCQGFSK
ncbi:MAG: hypothetical protein ACRC2R_20955 [Xenococcaceae cyanobacterium]